MANLKHVSPVVAPRPHNPYVRGSTPLTATNPLDVNELDALSEGVAAVVQSARPSIADILAPAYVNHGRKTAIHPNRVCIVGDTALMFCRASNGGVVVVRVDRDDLVRVLRFGSWRVASFCKKNGASLYAYTSKAHRLVYLHRFILNAPDPKTSGLEVDHEHRRTLDCRRREIRLTDKSTNQRNRGHVSGNKWGFRGVLRSRNGKRFIGRVWVKYKIKQVGTFDTAQEAGQAVKDFNNRLGACL